jgi:NAD(P)-dependent dehydrogenase (short-subunit alcohol dehydrogenase family)
MNILVTGAARGLGFSLAAETVKRGHHVYAGIRLESDACELESLSRSHPGQVTLLRMDVAEDAQVARALEGISHLDGVINNAAINIGGQETIETLDLDLVRQTMEINLIGAMRVVQKTLPLLYQGSRQVIINISSEAGTIINAFPTNYPYAISKTALNMFTERLRAHLADKGFRVYAIHPGWMRTGMGGEAAPADPSVIASGILDIVEGKTRITSKIAFIDATGRPMPL